MKATSTSNGGKEAHLRAATTADALAIEAIELASFTPSEYPFSIRQIRGLIANPRAVVLVADGGGRVLAWGAGLVRRNSSRTAYVNTPKLNDNDNRLRVAPKTNARSPVAQPATGRVYSLATHPDARGQGLGRRLMAAILAGLRDRSAVRIFLEVRADNASAVGLYHSLGFRDVIPLPHYYGKGVHGVRMVLE